MSATNRGSKRDEFDFYETPAWCVASLLEAIDLPEGGSWLEPTAGRGAILRAVKAFGTHKPSWWAVEIDPQHREGLEAAHNTCGPHRRGGKVIIDDVLAGKNNLLVKHVHRGTFDVVITNPPFRWAEAMTRAFLGWGKVVALLLRGGFCETESRSGLLISTRPSMYVLPSRPSFRGTGSDASLYAWFVWGPGFSGDSGGRFRVLRRMSKEERATWDDLARG